MVSSTFYLLNFDGSVQQIVISYYYNKNIKQMSDYHLTSCGLFLTSFVTIATV